MSRYKKRKSIFNCFRLKTFRWGFNVSEKGDSTLEYLQKRNFITSLFLISLPYGLYWKWESFVMSELTSRLVQTSTLKIVFPVVILVEGCSLCIQSWGICLGEHRTCLCAVCTQMRKARSFLDKLGQPISSEQTTKFLYIKTVIERNRKL